MYMFITVKTSFFKCFFVVVGYVYVYNQIDMLI